MSITNYKNKYTLMAIDGTYNTGENYLNYLNMGYFDITNNIPIEISMIGTGKQHFKQHLNKINGNN